MRPGSSCTNGFRPCPSYSDRVPYSEDQDEIHSSALYSLLENEIVPMYYARGEDRLPYEWVHRMKQCLLNVSPQFNCQRMVGEYLTRFYVPASHRGKQMIERNYKTARDLAEWKRKVRAAWPHVTMRSLGKPELRVAFGDKVRFSVGVHIDRLMPEDIKVELLLAPALKDLAAKQAPNGFAFTPDGVDEHGDHRYVLDLAPELCGKLEYRVRAYPHHPALSHPFELGLMKWV